MDYPKQFNSINKIFEESFKNSYKSIKSPGKSKILKYALSFYRRWFYSALVEDTFLSPSNLFSVLHEQHGYNCCDFPLPRLSYYNRQGPMTFSTQEYSIESHPIVEDLKIFLDTCSPDFELTPDDSLSDEHQLYLMKKLSISDPFYIDYLTVISINLSLIKKTPSIYSNRAQLTAEYKKFINYDNRQILDMIFDAAVDLTVYSLSRMLPVSNIITPDYIRKILETPVTTDEIFDYIYAKLGLDIGNILEYHTGNPVDEMYEAILSSTFYFGIVMDKYFYTPFGFYLRFINPSYLLSYDIKKDMQYTLETWDESEDISVAIFSPCSHYRLTELGREYFGIKKPSFDIPVLPELPFSVLLDLVLNKDKSIREYNSEVREMLVHGQDYSDANVYDLKIRLAGNKAYWKNMDVLDNLTLHDLYMEICYEFNFDVKMDYSFYSDLSQSPFLEYTSPIKKRRSKKAETTLLSDLNLTEKNRFMLVLYDIISPFDESRLSLPVKAIKIELELRRIKARSYNKYYPMVTRESQSFSEMNYEWQY